ncbi:MAG TPA: hypothetical protein VFA65_02930 [Bryobacteraceae bacterium]|nr:hypothetical protein [Bryobacteraceae bacterium]
MSKPSDRRIRLVARKLKGVFVKIQQRFMLFCQLAGIPFLLLTNNKAMGSDKHVCMEPNPAQMCTPNNTCGSVSTPCIIDIKRSGSSAASATPNIGNAKSNALFCIRAGTTVTWVSSSKNTGFVVDFGPSSPFDSPGGAIMGGADRQISVQAKKPGCYRYSVGACTAGTIYGMCGSSETEIVVIGAGSQ